MRRRLDVSPARPIAAQRARMAGGHRTNFARVAALWQAHFNFNTLHKPRRFNPLDAMSAALTSVAGLGMARPVVVRSLGRRACAPFTAILHSRYASSRPQARLSPKHSLSRPLPTHPSSAAVLTLTPALPPLSPLPPQALPPRVGRPAARPCAGHPPFLHHLRGAV